MAVWAEADEGEVVRLCAGLKNADGRYDDDLLLQISRAYDRALFFTRDLGKLRGLSDRLRRAAWDHELLPRNEIPGRALISTVCDGGKPASLEGTIRVIHTVQAVRDKGRSIPVIKDLAASLERRFPFEDVVLPGRVVHSLYAPEPDTVAGLRKLIDPEAEAWMVSTRMFEDSDITGLAARSLLARLEQGYEAGGRENGRYKLTERTARLVYECFAKLLEGRWLPPFAEVMPIDAEAGPRNGQVSRGLPLNMGNLLPDQHVPVPPEPTQLRLILSDPRGEQLSSAPVRGQALGVR